MSGLLHRLASRALGVAPAVRPIVSSNAPTAPFVPDSRRQEPERAHPGESAMRALEGDAALQAVASGESVPRIEATVAPTPVALPVPTTHSDIHAAQRSVETGASDARAVPGRATAEVRAGTPFDDVVPPRTERPRPGVEPDDAAVRDRLPHPEPLLAERKPLRPASRGTSLAASTDAGRRAANAPARAVEEITEVHVTIGRIELTAVQEAPRRRSEPARARKPQSLDEYLSRREAERR
jgi:hypothetical protein